jgi:hypothetical protein
MSRTLWAAYADGLWANGGGECERRVFGEGTTKARATALCDEMAALACQHRVEFMRDFGIPFAWGVCEVKKRSVSND